MAHNVEPKLRHKPLVTLVTRCPAIGNCLASGYPSAWARLQAVAVYWTAVVNASHSSTHCALPGGWKCNTKAVYMLNMCVQRLMEHGVGFMEKGNYPLALEAFEAAATLEPSFAEVRLAH